MIKENERRAVQLSIKGYWVTQHWQLHQEFWLVLYHDIKLESCPLIMNFALETAHMYKNKAKKLIQITVKPVHAFTSLTDWWIHSWNIQFILCFNNPLLKRIMQNSIDTWPGQHDKFLNISLFLLSLLSLPATNTLGMAFRYSEKLKTCDWEEKCLKYKNQNMRFDSWALCKSRNLSNSSCCLNQVSVWICIIHFKSELLKWRMKTIFHGWIH